MNLQLLYGKMMIAQPLRIGILSPLIYNVYTHLHAFVKLLQEEYMKGEDLGTLDSGHDFHTAYIKQWLTHNKFSSICKTTVLVKINCDIMISV